jgi:hypothetical protein
MRITAIILLAVLVTGCGLTGKDVIRTVNVGTAISNTTEAGVREEAINCASDWLDPFNRGSGCNR